MSVIINGDTGITTPGVTDTGTLSVTGVTTLTGGLNAALPVLSGGTGVTTKTGTGAVVLGTAPTITGATITVAATAAPAFSAYAGTVTSLISGTYTKVLFTTEEYDTNNNFASSRFTPTVAGYYQLNCGVSNASNSFSGRFFATVYKNGTLTFYLTSSYGVVTNYGVTGSVMVYANGSSDYFEIYAYQDGVNRNTEPSSGSTNIGTFFQGSMIRSA